MRINIILIAIIALVSTNLSARTHPIDGPIGLNYSKEWEPFKQYLQAFLDTVQIRQEELLKQKMPVKNASLEVKIRLSSQGRVQILDIKNNTDWNITVSLTSPLVTNKFNNWTNEMISKLGNSQELEIIFFRN